MQEQKTKLRQIREDVLHATKEDVIRMVRKLPLSTYVRAEDVGIVQYSTATKILDAINAVAKEQGIAEYKLEDLGLTFA